METIIIDNAGFDVEAMAKLSEVDFVKIHLDNDAIAPRRSQQEREQWLRDAHKAICEKAGPVKKPKKKTDKSDESELL